MYLIEDKELILNWLLGTLRCTVAGSDLVNIRYEQLNNGDELAVLIYNNGYRKTINITADSGIAMIRDITRGME